MAGFYGNLYKSQNIENQKIKKYLEDFRPNILGKDNNAILRHSIIEEEIRAAIKVYIKINHLEVMGSHQNFTRLL